MKTRSWPTGSPGGARSWCAAILLLLLLIATLHAAVPHPAAQRHCLVCQALEAPGLSQPPTRLLPPVRESTPVAAHPIDGAPALGARCLKPLRAPPAAAV